MVPFLHKFKLVLVATASIVAADQLGAEQSRDYMMIVGSTTVKPFSSMVVDKLTITSEIEPPMVQYTGSGGGLMLFCAGVGVLDPDVAYASRRIRKSEFKRCQENGVDSIIEVKVGYDGIVLTRGIDSSSMNLSLRDIYLALAKEVPDPKGGHTFIANPYKTWQDVNKRLPNEPIIVWGPSGASGTNYVFSRLAMEGGCRTFDWIRALKNEDLWRYKTTCRTLRDDGVYVAVSENDDATVKKLTGNPHAVAIFGFSILERNQKSIRGLQVDNVEPDFDTISNDSYPISRPLYLYVKKAHVDVYPGIREFLQEFTSDLAWGDQGYLATIGLVPMLEEERRKYAADAKNLKPMSM